MSLSAHFPLNEPNDFKVSPASSTKTKKANRLLQQNDIRISGHKYSYVLLIKFELLQFR